MSTPGRYEWMYDDTPELAFFADDEARGDAMHLMRKRLLGFWFWLYVGSLAMLGGVVVGPGLSLAQRFVPFVPNWMVGAGAVLGYIVLFYLGFALFWTQAIRRELRRQLIEQGVAICQGCGYDCRGNTSEACPECGLVAQLQQQMV